jgi:hypothetical protein
MCHRTAQHVPQDGTTCATGRHRTAQHVPQDGTTCATAWHKRHIRRLKNDEIMEKLKRKFLKFSHFLLHCIGVYFIQYILVTTMSVLKVLPRPHERSPKLQQPPPRHLWISVKNFSSFAAIPISSAIGLQVLPLVSVSFRLSYVSFISLVYPE